MTTHTPLVVLTEWVEVYQDTSLHANSEFVILKRCSFLKKINLVKEDAGR